MVVFGILVSTMLGLPTPLVEDREAGIFRTYKVNGVPSSSILLVPVLTTLLHLVVVSGIITATGGPLFGGPLPVNWAGFLLAFAAMAISSAGLGVLIGVVVDSARTTVIWSQLIFLPSFAASRRTDGANQHTARYSPAGGPGYSGDSRHECIQPAGL